MGIKSCFLVAQVGFGGGGGGGGNMSLENVKKLIIILLEPIHEKQDWKSQLVQFILCPALLCL